MAHPAGRDAGAGAASQTEVERLATHEIRPAVTNELMLPYTEPNQSVADLEVLRLETKA